jgi:aminoglycoside 6'-N-acetyltransferase
LIEFRTATIEDLPILKFWDTQPHLKEAGVADQWEWEKVLLNKAGWQELLMATLEKRPIGFVQIIDPEQEETHYWGNVGPNKRAIDIWIGEARFLGKGYGKQMMDLALGRCFSDDRVTEVLVDPMESNQKAINFYKRCGFKFLEYRKLGGDLCPVYSITKERFAVYEAE